MTDHPAPASTAAGAKPDGERVRQPAWIERDAGQWHWRIRSDWAVLLESCDSPNWLDLKHDPRAKLVKTNELRDVFRVETNCAAVFAKIARPAARWDRLRRLVLGPDCLREWRAAEYARQRGIQTIVPLAAGWAPINGREPASILITLETQDVSQLDTWWQTAGPCAGLSRTDTNHIIDATAELIARAHHGGFIHTDLHGGNILVRTTRDGRFDVCFVDLQAVSIGRRVGERRAIRNLACFGHWFRANASLTDRLRFLHLYLAWRERLMEPGPCWLASCREFIPRIDRAVRAHAQALAAQRDRQALRDGRRFGILRFGRHVKAHVFLYSKQPIRDCPYRGSPFPRDWWRETLAALMEAPLHARPDDECSVSTVSLPASSGGVLNAILQYDRPPSFTKRLKYTLWGSPAMRTWKMGNALANRGIPAARPLAVCERRHGGLFRDSLVLIECPAGAESLQAFLDSRLRDLPPQKRRLMKTCLARQIATLLRGLDEAGFVHRDLKASDIMLWSKPLPNEGTIAVALGEYLAVRRTWLSRPRANLHALSQLNSGLSQCPQVSRTDRLRVLKHYLDRIGRPAADWKHAWREMEEHRRA